MAHTSTLDLHLLYPTAKFKSYEPRKPCFIDSDPQSTWVSLVYFKWTWLSRVSLCYGLTHHLPFDNLLTGNTRDSWDFKHAYTQSRWFYP